MKKYVLKRNLMALGLAGIITFTSTCSTNHKKPVNIEEPVQEEELIDPDIEEQPRMFLANDILVLDKNFLSSTSIKENYNPLETPQYRLVELKRENYDRSKFYNNDLINSSLVRISTNLVVNDDDIYNSYGNFYYKEMFKKRAIVEQEYLLEGVIPLNIFLQNHNLTALIKSKYTEEDLEDIYNYLNQQLVSSSNYNLKDLLVLDMSTNPNWLGNIGTRNYYIIAPRMLSLLDQNYIKAINTVYNNGISTINIYEDIKYKDIDIEHAILKNLNGSLKIAITGTNENPEAAYFFSSQSISNIEFFTIIKSSFEDGFKIWTLEDFLQTNNLADLINDTYDQNSLLDIYNYINENHLTRIK